LHGESWATLIEEMRACLKLEEAWIEGLSKGPWGDQAWEVGDRLPAAEDYLVHGGENPFRNGALQ
jgi:hypothetical protein